MRQFSVRLRFTALCSALFLITSTIALVAMNVVLQQNLQQRIAGLPGHAFPGSHSDMMAERLARGGQHRGLGEVIQPPFNAEPTPDAMAGFTHGLLAHQWTFTILLLAVLTALSIGFGWWLAGRMLRPVRHITDAARRLSISNLHERIALDGPADELYELAGTFDTMLERLERSVNNERRFIANVAHELRTPLAIQRTAIEVGLDKPAPERVNQVREDLLEVNRRIERLIDRLLLLAQANHGLESTELVAFDATVLDAIKETTLRDGVTIHHRLDSVTIEGDAVLLHRLAANLIENAVRYNRPGGHVDVRLTGAGELSVVNTGPEIPNACITDLFQPFRRLQGVRSGVNGSTGLGLSIVASIARAHRASITAHPNPGGGLLLKVQFQPSVHVAS
jgi:signal transduction histidine kinase